MIQPCYLPTQPITHTGEPVPIHTLRYGTKFKYSGLQGTYEIYGTDPIKIKRPDGWIVRCENVNQLVFKV